MRYSKIINNNEQSEIKNNKDGIKSGFSQNLANLRQSNGETQEDLAKYQKVARTTVTGWEQGVNYPSIDHLNSISNRYAVPLDMLVNGKIDYVNLSRMDYSILKRNIAVFFPLVFPRAYCEAEHFEKAITLHTKLLFDSFSVLECEGIKDFLQEEITKQDKNSWLYHYNLAASSIGDLDDSSFVLEALEHCEEEYSKSIISASKNTQEKLYLCSKANLISFYLLCSAIIMLEDFSRNVGIKGTGGNSSPKNDNDSIDVKLERIKNRLHNSLMQERIFKLLGDLSREDGFRDLSYYFMALMYFFNLISNKSSPNMNLYHGINDIVSLARMGNEYALDWYDVYIQLISSNRNDV